MVLRKVPKDIARRLNILLQKEQIRTGDRKPERAKKLFLKLKSADHRLADTPTPRKIGCLPHYKVRRLRTKKGNIIIKPAETKNAKMDIRFIRKMVTLVNSHKPQDFILLKPKAAAIGPYVAMMETLYPSLVEISGSATPRSTLRGDVIIERAAEDAHQTIEETRMQVLNAGKELYDLFMLSWGEENKKAKFRTQKTKEAFEFRNILFLGMKNGKPIFIPLIDPF